MVTRGFRCGERERAADGAWDRRQLGSRRRERLVSEPWRFERSGHGGDGQQ